VELTADDAIPQLEPYAAAFLYTHVDTEGTMRGFPADVAARLNFAFERYFPPCRGEVVASRPERFEGELRGLPSCMNGLYVQCTVGFYVGALEGAGARNVILHFERPAPDGARAGVPLERIRFAAQWTITAGDEG